jgi:hypothetical protein
MSPRIPKELTEDIFVSLTIIMRESLNTAVVPDDWKVANVTPIFRKGSINVSNYRPVSLTSQLGKVFETMLWDAIIDHHLEKFNLIRSSQNGFQKGGSCLCNLLQFLAQVTH